ncbi:hypothetical protein C8R44DRAFT_725507 [Mycena epipterygia]|nr:hypothetical protein C8R44DRAFT_725507 [Mycena epipterygia]
MPRKEVHWKLTVDEYTVQDSPESRTSTLPSPPSTSAAIPPPTPRLVQDLPLPPTFELHHALTPTHALQLDFSFPSDAFRRNPQLTPALLAAPACTPASTELCIRIAAGLFKVDLVVTHYGQAVTVGAVLTAIQGELRKYDDGVAPPEAAPYMLRRIATVNGYCLNRDPREKALNVAAEQQGKGRFVDHLLGHTLFAGLTLREDQPDHFWQLELAIPQRYVY